MRIEGKDDDDPKTPNAQIAYRIISQEPKGKDMFYINEDTGELFVGKHLLDREVLFTA